MNLYGYAGGDPVNYSDPFGLCPNPLAQGLGSLQCALEDIVGAVKAGPSIFAGAVKSLAGDKFVRGMVLLSLTVGPVGEGEAINVTARGLAHVVDRHTIGGAAAAGKSVFNASEKVVDLV